MGLFHWGVGWAGWGGVAWGWSGEELPERGSVAGD